MPEVTLITTSQVAKLLGVDSSAVRKWVAQHRITPAATTPGGHYRFNRSDIDRLLATPEVVS
ncbi:MAG: helix-turn-helix domain-containing protein [Rhodococcus sp. (in: high G+C Gram-positive bacteria)]